MKPWTFALALFATTHVGSAHYEGTVKCADANGHIVYVDLACEVYGLRSIGPVRDRMTVSQANPSSETQDAATPEGERACTADANKFCSQVGGQVVDCLLDHQNDISNECYNALKERLQSERGMQACEQDSQRFCPGVQQGGGRVVDCLIDHEQEISEDCYQFLKSKRGSAN
jgi:hypothetical protein